MIKFICSAWVLSFCIYEWCMKFARSLSRMIRFDRTTFILCYWSHLTLIRMRWSHHACVKTACELTAIGRCWSNSLYLLVNIRFMLNVQRPSHQEHSLFVAVDATSMLRPLDIGVRLSSLFWLYVGFKHIFCVYLCCIQDLFFHPWNLRCAQEQANAVSTTVESILNIHAKELLAAMELRSLVAFTRVCVLPESTSTGNLYSSTTRLKRVLVFFASNILLVGGGVLCCRNTIWIIHIIDCIVYPSMRNNYPQRT